MKKVKVAFWILALSLSLALLGAPAAWAYEFTFYGGGLWGQWDAYVNNGTVSDGPQVFRYPGIYSVTAPFVVTATAGIADNYTITGAKVNVSVSSYVTGFSADPSNTIGNTYANDNTVQPTVTGGIYFQITGGTVGDQVQVLYKWAANGSTGTGTNGIIGGPLAITVNEYNYPGGPGPSVWSHADINLSDGDSFTGSDNGSFTAYDGDIIGIYLSTNTYIDDLAVLPPETTEGSNAYNSMELDVVPLPGAVWLLGSGLVGLLGLRRKFRS